MAFRFSKPLVSSIPDTSCSRNIFHTNRNQYITLVLFFSTYITHIPLTVNSGNIVCIYYSDFVILDLNAILIFTILRKILLNSYKIFQNASLHYCVYNSVAFFAIMKNLTFKISEFTVINRMF